MAKETNNLVVKMLHDFALLSFVFTFGQEFVYYLWHCRVGRKLNPGRWIILPIGVFIQLVSYLLDKLDHSEDFKWMYLLVAKKHDT